MKNEDLYQQILNESLSLWKKYSVLDFKKEIASHAFTSAFYSKLRKDRNYYYLGSFNYLIDIASNVHYPEGSLLLKKPSKGPYFEYLFENNNLVLVRHYEGLGGCLTFYISGDYVFELDTPDLTLSALWHCPKEDQLMVSMNGLQSEYFKQLDDTHYERISSTLLYVSASILEKRDGVFYEQKVTDHVIRSREEVDYLNENFNPNPFDKEYLDTLFKYFVKPLKK